MQASLRYPELPRHWKTVWGGLSLYENESCQEGFGGPVSWAPASVFQGRLLQLAVLGTAMEGPHHPETRSWPSSTNSHLSLAESYCWALHSLIPGCQPCGGPAERELAPQEQQACQGRWKLRMTPGPLKKGCIPHVNKKEKERH